MSNYTKTVNFAAKDALTTGDANKIVKGTEIDTEFNNIATAVATKYDSASTIPVTSGGTGASSLSGAGIPTFSGTNSFTGLNGFGITAVSKVSIFGKPPTTDGTAFAGQNNGVAVPFAAASNETGGTLMTFYDGVFPASVTTNGYIQLNGAGLSYYSASDYRLKENIAPLSNAITKLKQIAPKTYTWIRHPESGTIDGFIAHELQAVAPYAVSGAKDEIDANGNPKYQGVDSSHLVPLLTAALQEAITRIEALEAKVG